MTQIANKRIMTKKLIKRENLKVINQDNTKKKRKQTKLQKTVHNREIRKKLIHNKQKIKLFFMFFKEKKKIKTKKKGKKIINLTK